MLNKSKFSVKKITFWHKLKPQFYKFLIENLMYENFHQKSFFYFDDYRI